MEKLKGLAKNPFLWGFIIAAVSLVAIRPLQNASKSAPPPLLQPGAWQLTDHNGKAFGSKELEGQVYIADFFFTSCPSFCPELTKKMKLLTERIGKRDNIKFVSFSVDPETDTPEKLREYMGKYAIDEKQWIFVTGTRKDMHALLANQFKLNMGEKQKVDDDPQSTLYDISHSGKFVLFDQRGDLRAFVSPDSHGLARISDAARLLLDEGPDA